MRRLPSLPLQTRSINELTVSLRDMKSKFIKPTLKKVSNLDSNYENNFVKLKILVSTFSLEK